TEAFEFQSIYGLEVIVIPTNRPTVRKDSPDLVFLKHQPKWNAIVEDIRECQKRKQPVLVGTASIEASEFLSRMLQKEGVKHEVLNAKQHEREAHIVAQAGRPGAVTIATNMAGRGTDIVLGGSLEAELAELPADAKETERNRIKDEWKKRHDEVLAAGGLHIVGTERHESRRIDNQLRGRSGRQGDPGSSRFYLSLEDNLMRIFSPDWVSKWMKIFGMKEDDALEDRMVSRQIEKVQRKVEQHNFDIRKNLLEFDDVANDQRKVIYEQRNELLDQDDFADTALAIRNDVFADISRSFVPEHSIDEQWDIPGLERKLADDFGIELDLRAWLNTQQEADAKDVQEHVQQAVDRYFREREAMLGSDVMRALEKHVMLNTLDNCWKEHLASMDYLRQGIYLRGYAQKQPKQEFKRESFELFQTMLDRIKNETTMLLARVRIRSENEMQQLEDEQRRAQQQAPLNFAHAEASGFASEGELLAATAAATGPVDVTHDGPKVGRNDPCPCGSGKKYKQCHGRLA
ncbi:MAG TPA: SEC-C metal-binding domain-containing protein, partial [Tahibacter sp.]|nr:SEC-C metal-binding domain-containing protein [Tahibacter sp.]